MFSVVPKFFLTFQLGLDEEDGDHEEYLEEMDEDSDEEEGDEDDEESEEEEDEGEETGQVQLLSQHPLPASLMPSGSKGSIITCCPRILGGSSPCNLDRNLPRLSCGHFAVPTRDVAIQGKKRVKNFTVRTIRKVFTA